MRTSGKLMIAGFLALTGVTANAHNDDDGQTYNYTIKAHNHYGEAVHFSCNDITPQEIHDGKTLKLRFRAGADVDVDCEATHDDDDVWSATVHLDSRHRRAKVEITDQGQNNDSQSQHDGSHSGRNDNQSRFNDSQNRRDDNQSRFNNSQSRRDDNQSRFNNNQSRHDDSYNGHDEGRLREAPSTPQSILNQLFPK